MTELFLELRHDGLPPVRVRVDLFMLDSAKAPGAILMATIQEMMAEMNQHRNWLLVELTRRGKA